MLEMWLPTVFSLMTSSAAMKFSLESGSSVRMRAELQKRLPDLAQV